jgi:integrase
MQRLRRFFAEVTKIAVRALTPGLAEKLYETLTGAVDSRHNILAESKTFLRWCREKGWTRIDALEHVRGMGRRRRGKPQLTTDEARKFPAKALELAEQEDDEGAIAAAMALLMGMRASEIVERTTRNLDDDGRLLWITDAKTQAGIRRLAVPPQLQAHLQRIARGKKPTDRLFKAKAGRYWLLRSVQRICKEAGVPIVPAHGFEAPTRPSRWMPGRPATWWRRRWDTSRSAPRPGTTPAPRPSRVRSKTVFSKSSRWFTGDAARHRERRKCLKSVRSGRVELHNITITRT